MKHPDPLEYCKKSVGQKTARRSLTAPYFVNPSTSSLTVNIEEVFSVTEEIIFYTFDNVKLEIKHDIQLERQIQCLIIIILKKVYFHQYKSCNIETLIAHNT